MERIIDRLIEGSLATLERRLDLATAYTGMHYDFGTHDGWLNSWQARDAHANIHGTWESRFSFEHFVHGRWYCVMKPQ